MQKILSREYEKLSKGNFRMAFLGNIYSFGRKFIVGSDL